VRVTSRDVEKLFAGTPGAGLGKEAMASPDAVFIDLCLALRRRQSAASC
jgi:NosR/NirI family nitrous oxide reductase transcriptional regulator